MRSGQQNRYMARGRNNGNRKNGNQLARTYDSTGPDVKVRGSAQHIAEKYALLARDALSMGDRVMAENYLQHSEHYNRIVFAALTHSQQNPSSSEAMDTEISAESVKPKTADSEEAIVSVVVDTAFEIPLEAVGVSMQEKNAPKKNKMPRRTPHRARLKVPSVEGVSSGSEVLEGASSSVEIAENLES